MKATIALEATVLISIPAYAADVPARLPDLDGTRKHHKAGQGLHPRRAVEHGRDGEHQRSDRQ